LRLKHKPNMADPERSLISACIRTGDLATALAAGVSPEWFINYRPEWQFMEVYYSKNKRIPSRGLIKTRFPELRLLPVDDVYWAVEEMRVHHGKQLMLDMVDNVIGDLDTGKDVNLIMQQAQRGLITVQSRLDGGRYSSNPILDWKAVYGSAWARQKLASKSKTNASGIPTGFASLDAVTGGYHGGDYVVVAARLGQGKTWFLVRTAVEALADGKTVQFHALEQNRTQLMMRFHPFLSRRYRGKNGKVFRASDLMRGEPTYTAREYRHFLQGLGSKVPGTLIVDDTPRGKLTTLSLQAQIERNQPDMLIIDYLTLMAMRGADWQAIGDLSADIKGLAGEYGISVIVAAQLNRMATMGRDPGAEHLARSDAIGQDADGLVVLMKESRHAMRASLVKYRHGEDLRKWWNEFRPNDGVFEEISRDEADTLKDQDADEDDS
jgi:hypothetical protein